jgi:hypothetical protein
MKAGNTRNIAGFFYVWMNLSGGEKIFFHTAVV